MRNSVKIAVALAALMTASGAGQAKLLYGVTTTTWEEGNARVVSIDTDELSQDASDPTPFTAVSTFEHAADFMAGTWAKDKYYCYYNSYNQELDLSLQYFGILNMRTGDFTQIAEENHVTSDNVTDMMDMTYDPVGGGLLGLDRQYVPSQNKFVSTIQNISKNRGTLNEVCVLDKKYSGLCADGKGGFYLAELVRVGDEEYTASFYTANNRFSITPMEVEGDCIAQSSFAHSLVTDGENLYFAAGSVLTIVDLAELTASSYYLEKDLYGLTLDLEKVTGVESIDAEALHTEYYTLEGIRVDRPIPGSVMICRTGDTVKKIIVR